MPILQSIQTNKSAGSDGIDFLSLIGVVRRRWAPFVAIIVGCLMAAYVLTSIQTPTYDSTVSLVLDSRKETVVDAEKQVVSTLPLENIAISTEVRLITSIAVAQKVVDKLHLDKMPEYRAPGVSAAQILLSQVSAMRSGQTYVIDITVTTEDPKLSQAIAQAYAEAYLERQAEDRTRYQTNSANWLEQRLNQMRGEVLQADVQLQDFKSANNLLVADGSTVAEAEVSSLNQQIALAQADMTEKRARRDSALFKLGRAGTSGDTEVVESLSSDLVRELRKKRSEAAIEEGKLLSSYGPKHPLVLDVRERLRTIDEQLKMENDRSLASLNADAKISEQRYNSLVGSRDQALSSLRANGQSDPRLLELTRKSESLRLVYESFLNRSREIMAQIGLPRAEAKIVVDASLARSPSSPVMRTNMAVGLLAGLLIAGAWAGIAEYLDQTYRSGRELTEDLNIANLASIPMIVSKQKNNATEVLAEVIRKPFSLYTEAIRTLRTQIQLAGGGRPLKVISVTSALPGEGKTTVSISLARALAKAGARVLLIDADLRRKSLTKNMGGGAEYGLEDVFRQPALLPSTIINDELSGANMILVPKDSRIGAETISSNVFNRFVRHVAESYDFVILDTAPILALSDSRIISSISDGVLLVVRWNKTPRDAVQIAKNIIEESKGNLLGACLSQVDTRSVAFQSYGDSLQYFNSFKDYWSDEPA